jgi:hypothetical protein
MAIETMIEYASGVFLLVVKSEQQLLYVRYDPSSRSVKRVEDGRRRHDRGLTRTFPSGPSDDDFWIV